MKKFAARAAFAILLIGALLTGSGSASSQEQILYDFQGGSDGSVPPGPLTLGLAGDGKFYGTTSNGGGSGSEGTVFVATPPAKPGGPWAETVLHHFSNFFEGQYPFAGVVADRSGNLYGTTWLGGNATCSVETCGTIFRLSPPTSRDAGWRYTVLHDFSGYDGGGTTTPLVLDSAGNLYGTTSLGGSGSCLGGCGVVYELSRGGNSWNETVLYNFPGVGHGENTFGGTGAPVTLDAGGNLYGTGFVPGDGAGGAVFELQRPRRKGAPWQYRNLYVFRDLKGGVTPEGGVTFDKAGKLYGTTRFGGDLSGCAGNSCGTVFRLTPTRSGPWTHTLLHAFTGTGDGGFPQDSLTVNAAGTLIFGTTPESGSGTGCGCGTLFRLASDRHDRLALTVLHTFAGTNGDGDVPSGGVTFGPRDLLYGVTKFGGSATCDSGSGCGTIYSAVPSP